ncbi:MAG: hypothetical protein ACJ76Z_14790 [Thermoleophilaceae bacterium]
MGELGDLLELLHRSGRFNTVRAEFRIWSHHERAMEAFRADAEESSVTMYPPVESGEARPSELVRTAKLWIERPDKARIEQDVGDDDHIAVKSGDAWWLWSPTMGGQTNQGANHDISMSVGDEFLPLLEPAPSVGLLEWEPLGDGERIGRPVARARARPRERASRRDLHWELHSFGTGADEYLIDVDHATGALLRIEARRSGEPFEITEVAEVAFDEDLPAETFVLDLPEGETMEPVEAVGSRDHMPLAEVLDEVDFTVLVPDRVPPDWRLDVHYMPARKRPPSHARVTLWYRSEDGTGALTIGQSRAGDDDDEYADMLHHEGWEQLERDGVRFNFRKRSPNWPQPQLQFERDGTSIFMNSDQLSNDDLVALALSMRPAAPPSIAETDA